MAGQRRLPGMLRPHYMLWFRRTPPAAGPCCPSTPANPFATPCLQVCEALAAGCERPLILPLSRKSPDGRLEESEVAPADALAWTQVGF